jgi:glutamate formiminotransferase/glutamate formiminotransferase/formiminotetrahydrofolate cyclodeaminase
MTTLLTVPNVSEGTDARKINEIGAAFGAGGTARLLDVHSDPDHQRSVYTLAGTAGSLAGALLGGAHAAVGCVDIRDGRGAHPHVGALDVAPLVYLEAAARGAACAEALVIADRLADELLLPVFLYGELAAGRTRANLRRGGAAGLADRMAAGECLPDFGPARLHPTAGAVLVCAREPLVAFNLQLAPPATVADAHRIAALVREGGQEGLQGLRAIGVALYARADRDGPVGQVSMNIEHPSELALATVLEAVARHADIASAEVVGLAPRSAFVGFPVDLPMPGFNPSRQLIENALGDR